jgi:tetratricopeptide (TPR) repeat protein
MRGDFAKGREYSEQQREKLADLGPSVTAWSTSLDRARVELLAGDAEAAERELRADDAALAAIDERYFRSTIVAMLAGVLASRGLREEAEQAVVIARELADEDDVASQVLWRTAHARLLADASEGELATDAAERAVEIATEGDDIELLADAKAALGEVLWQLGRQESAEPPLREALALYERKEDIASATRVRLRLEVLLSGADPTAVG